MISHSSRNQGWDEFFQELQKVTLVYQAQYKSYKYMYNTGWQPMFTYRYRSMFSVDIDNGT